MKLPGISRLAVQSLGRQNSGLTRQAGQAQAGVVTAAIDTLAKVNEVVDKTIITPAYNQEAASQYADAEGKRAMRMAEVEAEINNPTGMIARENIPSWMDYREFDENPDGTITQRPAVPTYEIAKEYYQGELKRTREAAAKNMTNQSAITKMKSDTDKNYVSNYANVMLTAQKNKRTDQRAALDVATEMYTRTGDLDNAIRTVQTGMAGGVIPPNEGADLLIKLPGKVTENILRKEINTAGTIGELDGMEARIYDSIAMDFGQMDSVINELQTRRKAMEAGVTTSSKEASKRVLNTQLINLQEAGRAMPEEDLRAMAYSLSPEDHKALIVANKSFKTNLKGKSVPIVTATLQADINGLMLPVEGQSFKKRKSMVLEQISEALDNGELNATDSWALIQRINTTEQMPFKSPDMNLAVDQIYLRLTRGAKSSMGMLNTSPEDVHQAAMAERALFDAARNTGPSFDALGWLDKNLPGYMNKQVLDNQITGRSKVLEKYTVTYPRGSSDGRGTDSKLTIKKLVQANRKGFITKAELDSASATALKQEQTQIDFKAARDAKKANEFKWSDLNPWSNP